MSDMKPDETGTAIVPVLACVLNQLCLRNDRLPISQKGVSKFHALRPPAISIKEYLMRVSKYAACSGECFVLALVYIDRIIQLNPTFVVNSLNIHRLLITSIMLAAKFFDDQYFNNAYYAKVGGVPCSEINSLEVEFLFLCNFALFVNTETYSQYYTELCNHASNLNIANACSCSQGPQVPPLHIPQYTHISPPPANLEGHVLYPVHIPPQPPLQPPVQQPIPQVQAVHHLTHQQQQQQQPPQQQQTHPQIQQVQQPLMTVPSHHQFQHPQYSAHLQHHQSHLQ
jgi:hypothetical protein